MEDNGSSCLLGPPLCRTEMKRDPGIQWNLIFGGFNCCNVVMHITTINHKI